MKKLPYILILSNLLLLGSEQDKEYTKNTCHRTYGGHRLFTDKEREQWRECSLSRLEVYDKVANQYIAHIAYKPSECYISYLLVDAEHRKKGIGEELVREAIEDMRTNHNCRKISLDSSTDARKFWEKLGAKSRHGFNYVFPGS